MRNIIVLATASEWVISVGNCAISISSDVLKFLKTGQVFQLNLWTSNKWDHTQAAGAHTAGAYAGFKWHETTDSIPTHRWAGYLFIASSHLPACRETVCQEKFPV